MQNVQLLFPSDPEEHFATPVARDLQEYQMAQFEAQKQACQEAAQKAFEGTWIRATETELKECHQQYQASDKPSIHSNAKACKQPGPCPFFPSQPNTVHGQQKCTILAPSFNTRSTRGIRTLPSSFPSAYK